MFKQRSTALELMDQPGIPAPDLERNLRELAFINHWLGGHAVTLRALRQAISQAAAQPPGRVWRIADLGSGGGDNLLAIAQWAAQEKVPVQLTGIDLNPVMVRYAQRHTAAFPEIQFVQADAMTGSFAAGPFDLITCSLFCHHFPTGLLTQLLTQLRKSGATVILNDLHRHPLAYYSIKALTALFSRSYLVRHDAPLSVLRGFSRPELEEIFRAAGYQSYDLKWRWAFRWEAILPAQS